MSLNASEKIAGLAAALVKAQAQIEGATKDKTNPHFKSKYADLSSVVDAIKKPLADAKLSYTQVLHDADSAAKVETIILHESGEWLSCGIISVPVTKNDAQGYGSALTYARRYSLSAAFGVAPEDDDGNAAAKAAPRREATAENIAAANIKPLADAGKDLTPEQRKRVEECASEIIDCFEAGKPEMGFDVYAEKEFDVDEKNYLWTFLDSKIRRKIKEIGMIRNSAELAQHLATQA